VHAFGLSDPVLVETYNASACSRGDDPLQGYARELQARLESQIRRLTPSERVTCDVVPGSAGEILTHIADETDADLLVVGPARRGTLSSTILGSTAQRVLRRAATPVLLLRQELTDRSSRVLLTTDLSELSGCVHDWGVDLAEALYDTPELRSLLVVRYDVPIPMAGLRERVEQAARAKLQEFLEDRKAWDEPVDAKVRLGAPAKEIVAEAEDWRADLLVLGTHARADATCHLLGSVAAASVRAALCNVLVVPATAECVAHPDALVAAMHEPLVTL
jgi:nucleotide-binding universal stress UspA family protein